MSSEPWTEKAERLHSELDTLNSALIDGLVDTPKIRRELEQATIERFLRREFSDDPPEDNVRRNVWV